MLCIYYFLVKQKELLEQPNIYGDRIRRMQYNSIWILTRFWHTFLLQDLTVNLDFA